MCNVYVYICIEVTRSNNAYSCFYIKSKSRKIVFDECCSSLMGKNRPSQACLAQTD